MNQLTPEVALQNLANATEPLAIVRLNRIDFVNIQSSLVVLDAALKELAELKSRPTETKEERVNPVHALADRGV